MLEDWWAEPAGALLAELEIDADVGLAPERVASMRERYGANVVEAVGRTGFWALLWESLTSPMILLLLAVAGISLALGQVREAVVMAIVVLTYVGVELINKGRTDRTMARLRALQAPTTMVLRGGERREVDVGEVVVGDVVPLQAGSRVPADGRLLSTAGLLVNEAPLTGESAPQRKDAGAEVAADAPQAERPTAVFGGTTVLDGQGQVLVMAVGEATEMGRVAGLTARAEQAPTPLQEEMRSLARTLAYVAVGVSFLIPLLGLLRGYDLEQMVLTWLSLTFLMVPGQPPIIITMALALAALELARKEVIVSRLRGAETLGSVTTILSDKTGTLTQNAMSLAGVVLGDGTVLDVGERQGAEEPWRAFFERALPAIPEHSEDPTDVAVSQAGTGGKGPGRLVNQVGFARGRVLRSLTYVTDEGSGTGCTYVAGAPEAVLARSERTWDEDATRRWDEGEKVAVAARIEAASAEGRRVTAYATRQLENVGDLEEDTVPGGLAFVGAAVIEDPLRPEVPEAVNRLAGAGVRTMMVTGDRPETAQSVARAAGLAGDAVLTGRDVEGLAEAALAEQVQAVDVFARVTPEHKLRLVEALQRQGETVAVTGDGVNDAPALRTAHIGVAMGTTGTDVAREAADLVLTDDDFAHLPDGVEIGRKAYENFRKGITYYLSAKAILLAAFVVPLLGGQPFPFAPIQIIAIELLMDLASSTIFITEAAEPGLMDRPPRRRRRFLSWDVARTILRNVVGPTVALLAAYYGSLVLGYEVAEARTAAFATWLLGHIVLALVLKQERVPLVRRGLLSNRFAVGWLVGMAALVGVMTTVPFLQTALETTPLSTGQWVLVIGGALAGGGWMEVGRWMRGGRFFNAETQRRRGAEGE